MTPRVLGTLLCALLLAGVSASGQSQPPPAPTSIAGPVDYARVPAEKAAVLEFGNRLIVTFRAEVLTRSPRERADGASRRLAALAADGVTGPVSQRQILDLILITVAGKDVFAVTPADADDLGGESQLEVAAAASRNLERALAEVEESRRPGRLARGAATAFGFTLLLVAVLWTLRRLRRAVGQRLAGMAQQQFDRTGLSSHVAVDTGRLGYWLQRGVHAITLLLTLVAVYLWLTAVLVLFPFTRPWGETLGQFLARTFERIGSGILDAIPGLFSVLIIVLLTRFVIRVMQATLDGVAAGRLHLPGVHPDTAVPTRRLLAGVLWLFAVVVSYPYLPGADTDAFKGVSVFVGLVLSLGSSGLVSHMMSGFLLTFSRAIKTGDYVRTGDTEGTVTMVGLLSTKVKTLKGEEVIIPNAVASGGTIVNYSRYAREGQLLLYTSVTIGYDTPWRQVEALLTAAADGTAGLAKSPKPFVLQRSLGDFYIEYQINAAVERPETRALVLSALHANIQDAFNDAGVQIMSPHYEADPAAPKIVPSDRQATPVQTSTR